MHACALTQRTQIGALTLSHTHTETQAAFYLRCWRLKNNKMQKIGITGWHVNEVVFLVPSNWQATLLFILIGLPEIYSFLFSGLAITNSRSVAGGRILQVKNLYAKTIKDLLLTFSRSKTSLATYCRLNNKNNNSYSHKSTVHFQSWCRVQHQTAVIYFYNGKIQNTLLSHSLTKNDINKYKICCMASARLAKKMF